MKKSEMTVSMPLTTWEEYENYKKKYAELTEKLGNCFDGSLVQSQNLVYFDVNSAQKICREFMPYALQNADIESKI